MPYKTMQIKLLNPSKSKRDLLEDAIDRYSTAFEILLREIKSILPAVLPPKTELLKLMDKNFFKCVSNLGVEPFKDALKIDLARLLAVYFSKKSSYPVTRTFDEDIMALLDGEEKISKPKLDAAFEKYQKKRPLLFCRFDEKRDYSIFQSEKGTYFAKLYLFNRKNAQNSKRYAVFPLDAAEWQQKFLNDMKSGICTPKSAELIQKKDEFYLNIRFWYPALPKHHFSAYIGIVRGINSDLYYAVSLKSGEIISTGSINVNNIYGLNKFHSLSNEIIRLAKENKAYIIMENLSTSNDNLKMKGLKVPLSVGDYNKIAFLVSYKAELAGLEIAFVSANSIFYRCTRCGNFKRANRFLKDKFICTMCGHSDNLEEIGSSNLAKTLITYKNNKIPVYYKAEENSIVFRLDILDYEVVCAKSLSAANEFCERLKNHIALNINNFSKHQQFTAKKLLGENAFSKINFIEIK